MDILLNLLFFIFGLISGYPIILLFLLAHKQNKLKKEKSEYQVVIDGILELKKTIK